MTNDKRKTLTDCQRRVLDTLARAHAPSLFASDLHETLSGKATPRQVNAAIVNLERMAYVSTKQSETDPLAQRHVMITAFGKDALRRSSKATQLLLEIDDVRIRKPKPDIS
jgi:DNA-binding MarR family transcriptional regulator